MILTNNIVAGSERIGYRVSGQPCSVGNGDLWSGNVVTGAMIGE